MNSKKIKDIITPDEYADIKPIDDKDFKEKIFIKHMLKN